MKKRQSMIMSKQVFYWIRIKRCRYHTVSEMGATTFANLSLESQSDQSKLRNCFVSWMSPWNCCTIGVCKILWGRAKSEDSRETCVRVLHVWILYLSHDYTSVLIWVGLHFCLCLGIYYKLQEKSRHCSRWVLNSSYFRSLACQSVSRTSRNSPWTISPDQKMLTNDNSIMIITYVD